MAILKLTGNSENGIKINLDSNILVPGGITELADFDNTYVLLKNGDEIDFQGDITVKFKMYLDASRGYKDKALCLFGNTSSLIDVILFDSSLYISKSTIYYKSYSIINNNLYNRILNCEIKKGNVGLYVSYLKVDDEELVATNVSGSSSSGYNASGIGTGGTLTQNGIWPGSLNFLDNATIWDIYVYDPSGANIHYWKGYPAGNTLQGWEDNIGTLDASVETVLNTRNVIGLDSSVIIILKESSKIKMI